MEQEMREIDRRIRSEVIGFKDSDSVPAPPYSRRIECAWTVVEKMVGRMGYANPGFGWTGPLYKPENQYLTNEGYPLGTTCWYVMVIKDGERKFICADTAPMAICKAALWVVSGEK